MKLSALDPKTALVIVDLHEDVASLPFTPSIAAALINVRALVDAFRGRSLPVVIINVDGGASGRTMGSRAGWAGLVPELNQQPTYHPLTKPTPATFPKTVLEEQLRTLGITQVVLAGNFTNNGVESTARQARESGFRVTLAIDALADADMDSHHSRLDKSSPWLQDTCATKEILNLLNSSRV